jgi:hypothetical protein
LYSSHLYFPLFRQSYFPASHPLLLSNPSFTSSRPSVFHFSPFLYTLPSPPLFSSFPSIILFLTFPLLSSLPALLFSHLCPFLPWLVPFLESYSVPVCPANPAAIFSACCTVSVGVLYLIGTKFQRISTYCTCTARMQLILYNMIVKL